MNQELKRTIILEHNQNPQHFNKTDNEQYQTINVNNVHCIDKYDLQIKMNQDLIEDIMFFGEGCAISKATTSIMTDLVIGKTKEQALLIIDNYLKMINEQAYDESVLNEAIAFDTIYKQANRKNCASLTWISLEQYLKNNL